MRKTLESRIQHDLTPLTRDKWDRLLIDLKTGQLETTKESLEMMRILFQLGYQDGLKDQFDQIKEIYFNDADFFIEMFEDE